MPVILSNKLKGDKKMSLTVNANAKPVIEPIPEGTYLAVCGLLVDLGVQYSKKYDTSRRMVMLGWEIPEETIVIDGQKKPRMVYNRYTASLNEKSILRKDLAAWRGRDFTAEELVAFDLFNVVGTSCYLNIIHNENNGKTYANISSIMALPRKAERGKLSEPPVVFNLDTATEEDIEKLPAWIADIVRQSETYKDRKQAEDQAAVIVKQFAELEDDGDLPF